MKKTYFYPTTESFNLGCERLMESETMSFGGEAAPGAGSDAPTRIE